MIVACGGSARNFGDSISGGSAGTAIDAGGRTPGGGGKSEPSTPSTGGAGGGQGANTSGGNFEKSTFDLDTISGHTLTFVAYARTDQAGKTSFFLDSLRLVATCGH